MNKEHLFPDWLILRTGTHSTGIQWGEKRVSARAATIPLCVDCNRQFGDHLEGPVRLIFDDIEAGRGLSDDEAELMVRWMWKLKGLAWALVPARAKFPKDKKLLLPVLRDRVLSPVTLGRKSIVLGLGLFPPDRDPEHEDLPMGVDGISQREPVFISGVFSRIAIMVARDAFAGLMPWQLQRYRLADIRQPLHGGKLLYPSTSFASGVEAVAVMRETAIELALAHDREALRPNTERYQ